MVYSREFESILRIVFLEISIVDAHASVYFIPFQYKNRVYKPSRMQNFSNESCNYQLSQFCSDCLPLIKGESMQLLPNQFHLRIDLQLVLDHLPGNPKHVCRLPCKHVPVILQEPNECAFLFRSEARGDGRCLMCVREAKVGLLGHFCWMNGQCWGCLRGRGQEVVLWEWAFVTSRFQGW